MGWEIIEITKEEKEEAMKDILEKDSPSLLERFMYNQWAKELNPRIDLSKEH